MVAMHRCKVKHREEKKENIVSLVEKGNSSRKIARRLGLSQSTVNRVRKRQSHNLDLSKEGHPEVL